MSREDKTCKFQCSMTKMTFCSVVQSFFIVSLYVVSEFKKIPSMPDHMLQGHLIVWNNVPGGQNYYFKQKDLQTNIHWFQILPEYCTRPYLYLNMEIFIQKYIWPQKKLIFVKCPGRTKIEVYQCDSLLTLGNRICRVGYKSSSRSESSEPSLLPSSSSSTTSA